MCLTKILRQLQFPFVGLLPCQYSCPTFFSFKNKQTKTYAISFSSSGSSIQLTAGFPVVLHSDVELRCSGSAWLSIPIHNPTYTIQQHPGSTTSGRRWDPASICSFLWVWPCTFAFYFFSIFGKVC